MLAATGLFLGLLMGLTNGALTIIFRREALSVSSLLLLSLPSAVVWALMTAPWMGRGGSLSRGMGYGTALYLAVAIVFALVEGATTPVGVVTGLNWPGDLFIQASCAFGGPFCPF